MKRQEVEAAVRQRFEVVLYDYIKFAIRRLKRTLLGPGLVVPRPPIGSVMHIHGQNKEGIIDWELRLYQLQSGRVVKASDTYAPTTYDAFFANVSDLKVGIENLLEQVEAIQANPKRYIAYRNRRGNATEHELEQLHDQLMQLKQLVNDHSRLRISGATLI